MLLINKSINGKKYGLWTVDNINELYYNDMLHSINDEPAFSFYDGSIKEWYYHGIRHRDNDKPASIIRTSNITVDIWYLNGVIHRNDDKPAYIDYKSKKEWYTLGVLHRDDKPAVIYNNQRMEYYKNGKLHRDNDLPAIVDPYHKLMAYYKNGKLHRDDAKPAIITKTSSQWYENGDMYHISQNNFI